MLTLIIGGSGSGKSGFAEEYILRQRESGDKLYYLATMVNGDRECGRRIERHRRQRDGKGFETIEIPTGIEAAVSMIEGKKDRGKEPASCVLLECLSNLAANEMFGAPNCGNGEKAAQKAEKSRERILQGLTVLVQSTKHLVIVSNQIFDDGILYDESVRAYQNLLAELNIAIAKKADTVVEVVAALPHYIKGE